jgi:hypothetical protein
LHVCQPDLFLLFGIVFSVPFGQLQILLVDCIDYSFYLLSVSPSSFLFLFSLHHMVPFDLESAFILVDCLDDRLESFYFVDEVDNLVENSVFGEL